VATDRSLLIHGTADAPRRKGPTIHREFEAFKKRVDGFKELPESEIPKEMVDEVNHFESRLDSLIADGKRLPKTLFEAPQAFGPIVLVVRRHQSLLNWISAVFVFVYIAVLVLFGPWPVILAVAATTVPVLMVARIARKTGRVALRDVWLLGVAIVLISVTGLGLQGTAIVGSAAGDYHFGADAQLKDGRYARLGESGGLTILMTCGTSKPQVIAVDDHLIHKVGFDPWKDRAFLNRPTLFGLITGSSRHPDLGFRSPC
jgi:hypothetical protein